MNADRCPSSTTVGIWAGCIVSALIVVLGALSLIVLDYNRRFADATHIVNTELYSASSYLENQLATIEAMMDSAASILVESDLPLLQSWLAKLIAGNSVAVQLGVVDLDGRLLASNIAVPTAPIDLSDREHIKVHLHGARIGLFISEPLIGRVSNVRTIQVSKIARVPGKEREVILVVSLDTDALIRELSVHSGESVFLVRRKGGAPLFSTAVNDPCLTRDRPIRLIYEVAWPLRGCISRDHDLRKVSLVVELRKSVAIAVGDWQLLAGLTMAGAIAMVGILLSSAAFASRIQHVRQQEAWLRADNDLIKRTRDLYADVLQHNGAYILVLDRSGAILFANDRTRVDLKPYLLDDVCDLQALMGARAIQESSLLPARTAVRTEDGTFRQIAWSISRLERSDTTTIIAYGIDRTQLDDLNSAVLHRLKLVDLGQIASTLIHEMKQPIAAIEFALPVALRKISADSPARAPLAIVERALVRMKTLNEKSRCYGQRSIRCEEAVAVSTACADASELLKYQFRQAKAQMIIDVPDELYTYCDGNYFSQVMVILLNNALEALASENVAKEQACIRITASRIGDEVEILVSDNGPGIPDAIREHLFTPYFTTKTSSGGMGLGLSVARTLMGEMLGAIKSIPVPKGASFQLTLPAAYSQSSEKRPISSTTTHEAAAKVEATSRPNN